MPPTLTMKRGLHIIILCLLFSIVGEEAAAQYYRNQGYWKKNRWEFVGGVGASNFLGELGGRDQVGSDFIWDLETKVFKPALTAGIRYSTSRKTNIRFQATYAVVAGDDALTKERFRFNRNLHFRSKMLEVAGIFEYTFFKVRPGHRYNLAGVKGQKPRAAHTYAFIGLGGMYFNPQGNLDGKWYDLKPLGTEGQNLRGGPDPYSKLTVVVPMGIGYRWRLSSEYLMVGLEIGHRLTFTDYIDDVSTVYYNQAELANQPDLDSFENILAAHFGDPSNGFGPDGEPMNSTQTGAQRGDPNDNDAYLFVQATINYKLSKKTYKKKRFSTKKGKRIVF